jgi:ABC-2 type transport system permease protein
MKLENIFTIAKKELKSFFDNPTAYIILIVFLVLWEFLFFRGAFLTGEASLRGMFSLFPWLFLFLIPAITMGSISQEKKEGTLEFLLTHPLRDSELVLGKFIASFLFSIIALAFVFPLAWSFSRYGSLDWGALVGQYLGGILMASVMISLGIFISSIFLSQTSVMLVSIVANLALIMIGYSMVTDRLSLTLAPIFEQLSITTHFDSISRGVLDLRDLWYFVSATIVFLSLAYFNLVKMRIGNNKKAYKNHQAAIILFIGICVLTNAFSGKIGGRIDLTQNKIYTLSDSTKDLIGKLGDQIGDGNVTIDVYASDKLPAQFQPVIRDTMDILKDYKTYGNGKITLNQKNPADDNNAKEANKLGIKEIQFNVVSQEEFQMKSGYLGIAVSYGDAHEVIPFVEKTNDLEYQLTSFIQKLTVKDKKKIGFVSGHGEKTLAMDYAGLKKELSKQFEVSDLGAPAATGTEKTPQQRALTIPDDVAAIVIAGPNAEISEAEKKAITDFVAKGKAAMFLVDTVAISQQTLAATANKNNVAEFLDKNYGIKVNADIAYDLRSNETVNFGSFFLPYPFWIQAQNASPQSPIMNKINTVILPWASSISVDSGKIKENGFNEVDLLKTTKYSGTQDFTASLLPDKTFSKDGLGEKTMAVSLEKDNGTRLIAVGDSEFLTDQYVINSPGNLSFAIGAMSWMAQEKSMAGIKIKNDEQRKMIFANQSEVSVVKYGNIAFIFLVPFIYGFMRIYRRRKLQDIKYEARS